LRVDNLKMLKFIKFTLFVFLIGMLGQYAKGQDVTYSQFYANPLYLNPALAGVEYCPRISAVYRNQWPALPGAFVSYSVAYDQYVEFLHGGLGMIVNYDKAGEAAISNISVNTMYAYRLNISENVMTNFALQAGYMQRSTQWDDFIFGSQIDPATGNIRPPGPIPSGFSQSISTVDFGGGILLGINEKYFIGAAANHLMQPDVGFFSEGDNLLNMKITVHAGANIELQKGYSRTRSSGFSIAPNILYQQQGYYRHLNLGAYLTASYFTLGLWYRNAFENPDAVIISLGAVYRELRFGYSYDITVSKLSTATGGAHEVSLAWIFQCDKKSKRGKAIKCPSF